MAYTISLYRPRFPTTAHNVTIDGERYYHFGYNSTWFGDYWVSPRTRQQIVDGASPVVMGTKIRLSAGGLMLNLASHPSNAYQHTSYSTDWTNHFNINLGAYGITLNEEFNLEVTQDATHVQVFVNGVRVANVASVPLNNYIRICCWNSTSYAYQAAFRHSYESNDMSERLGNWKFHDLMPVVLPDQPLTLSQLIGYAQLLETTAVNFRLDPEPLSGSGRVIAMHLSHDYLHRRRSPRGGSAQFRYEGISSLTRNLSLQNANTTSYAADRISVQADLSKSDLESLVHQIRYTLTPDEFEIV